ncbi:YrhC family protein [Bacillus sp. FJAT-27251]|uniref:YrhC family protein n=1 Tax=Bacillus sp. FJAT-27251 TaxID=1684142 RepID=UPI000AAD490B|nr:YrhC family protein [Bacillus sp. FJAT-27251]
MNAKKLYEKMVDYRQFGIVLMAVGAFFYLGVILPSVTAVMADKYIAMGASTGFLILSVLSFILAKKCQGKLAETEEGQEYLMNQKRP